MEKILCPYCGKELEDTKDIYEEERMSIINTPIKICRNCDDEENHDEEFMIPETSMVLTWYYFEHENEEGLIQGDYEEIYKEYKKVFDELIQS